MTTTATEDYRGLKDGGVDRRRALRRLGRRRPTLLQLLSLPGASSGSSSTTAAGADAARLRSAVGRWLALAVFVATLVLVTTLAMAREGGGAPPPAAAAVSNSGAPAAPNPILDWLRTRLPGGFPPPPPPPRRPEPSPAPDDLFGWKKCNDGTLYCGSLPVPLDHLNASDRRVISIAVVKYPAQAEPRLGTLFVNPGGPGGSGAGFVKGAGRLISLLTGGHHDILGFDPRGVGASHPVICYPSAAAHAAADIAGQSFAPPGLRDSGTSVPAFGALSAAIAANCRARSPDVLPFISTASTSRDMDLLRAALGEDKLNYWGLSYGTFLGISYVNMFPDRVGAVVLDGVVDPTTYTRTAEAWTRSALEDTEAVVDGFGRECEAAAAAEPLGCPLAGLVSDSRPTVAALLRGALDDLDAGPAALATGSAVPFLSGVHAAQALLSALYRPATWPTAAAAFYALLDPVRRDAGPLARFLGAVPADGGDDGVYCPATDGSGRNGFLAVKCADGDVEAGGGAEWEIVARRVEEEVSPLFGRAWAYMLRPCSFWPRPVERFAGPWSNTLSNKVLLIGNTLDPVTPLGSAKVAASAMTEANSVLLTQKGYGHCSLAQFSTCTVKSIQSFFTNGTLPEPGTVCEADTAPFAAVGAAKESTVFDAELRARFEEVGAMVARTNLLWK